MDVRRVYASENPEVSRPQFPSISGKFEKGGISRHSSHLWHGMPYASCQGMTQKEIKEGSMSSAIENISQEEIVSEIMNVKCFFVD